MRLVTAFSGFVAAALLGQSALAEPLRVHGRANAARAATGPQKDEQSWGALGGAMLEVPLVRQLGVGLEVGAVSLSDGAPPENPDLANADGALGFTGSLGLHLRPLARGNPGDRAWYEGLWAGGAAGAMYSAGAVRPTSEANVGLDFPFSDSGFSAGPSVGWLHVFQPDSELRPEDANLLSFGLHALFDGGSPREPLIEAAAPPAPIAPADTDGDGLIAPEDRCPDVAEDPDGFEDGDGCPETDNDADGVLDADDRCPLAAEDADGFEDDDGCPDSDDDGDGVENDSDGCPLEPEDQDGFADSDGCPDADNDSDGILDVADKCPTEAEVLNGYADDDGCPDADQVRVIGDKILLDERIHFWTNSWIIRSVSHPLLGRLARLLNEHPEYVHIEVQGHADERGDERFNARISQERAKAVKQFLIERGGVARERLSARGFGSSEPFTAGRDPRSLYLNRRVEFSVTRATPGAKSSREETRPR